MSLPRPVRMTRRRDFEAVRSEGTSVGSRLLAIGLRADPLAARLKAGVIVPKPLGSAPVRNRIKRRLREIIRHALPVLESVNPPPVFVIIARRASVNADFKELRAEWHRLARKVGLWPAGQPLPARSSNGSSPP